MRVRTVRFIGDLVFEGVETTDGRLVAIEATTWRTPPLLLRSHATGHQAAQPLGEITEIWRGEDRVCCAGTIRVGHGLRRALMRHRHVLAADLSHATHLNERSGVLVLDPAEILGATLIDGDFAPWAGMRLIVVR